MDSYDVFYFSFLKRRRYNLKRFQKNRYPLGINVVKSGFISKDFSANHQQNRVML